MINPATRYLLAAIATLLSACASPEVSTREIKRSDPSAVRLVAASQRAHGRESFSRVRDLSVRYKGRWAPIGPRFQPVLSDRQYRRESEERLVVGGRTIAQEHTGPSGKKLVVRKPGTVAVAYNGARSADAETGRAAALVADAYTLFLLGPFYFDRPGILLETDGEAVVDKAMCSRVLAILRPGFGLAEEDRVILYIDQVTRQLRRVRMTLSGLESTRGAEVDVTFRNFRRVGGVLWPTDFDERIRVPFNLHAHHWKMDGLEINRGFAATDLTLAGLKGRAAASAAPLAAYSTLR